MSACRSCGKPVAWYKSPGSSAWHRPVEPVRVEPGLMTLDRAGAIVPLPTQRVFRVHRCSEADVRAHEEAAARMAEQLHLRQGDVDEVAQRAATLYAGLDRDQRLAYRHAQQEAQWRAALQRDCPKCREPLGTRCANLQDRRLGREERRTANPHVERYPGGVPPQLSVEDWLQAPEASVEGVHGG